MAGIQQGIDAYKTDHTPFVDFTTSLVRDVYKVIVDSSIEQMQSYAELVKDLAKPVAIYQQEISGIDFSKGASNTENVAQLNNYVIEVLQFPKTTSGDPDVSKAIDPELVDATKVHLSNIETPAKNGVSDVFDSKDKADLEILQELIFEKLDQDTRQSRDMLITILQLGFQKIAVTDGRIATKLMFDVSASESSSRASTDVSNKASDWGVQGNASARWGWGKASVSGGYKASNVSVRVVNERNMSATNMSASLTGEVVINFRTESHPSVSLGE